ncbi:hypothetical protein [Halalkalibacter krulwichiae]|uniref:Uncharacterized protein n=1 Tax=Halalkalibacter krulwichiae TaxID=199441 RepID=A0A1X9MGW1_9BACI|nr:hypothetical protein [Halalkalibacter krulwichiae]ARK31864.1 hypothetical protein BkAM31D_19605 [Halalkalibacter krulwichiae]
MPPKYESFNVDYLDALEDIEASLDMLSNAIETGDDSELDYANKMMERGVEKLNRVHNRITTD